MHQLFSLHFQKDNILILCGVRHYPVNFVIDLQENIKFHDPIYLEWAFYVENASSRNICRVFEKPINSHLQLYIIPMSCSKCNFAKICRMKQFEIWGKSINLWLLWYFHPIKCTFWIKLNKQYQDICHLQWIMVGLLCNMLWSKCLYFLCERRDMKKSVQCYPFS